MSQEFFVLLTTFWTICVMLASIYVCIRHGDSMNMLLVIDWNIIYYKALIDIILRPRCAVLGLTAPLHPWTSRRYTNYIIIIIIICACLAYRMIPSAVWRHDIIGDWMISYAANAAASVAARIANAFEWPGQPSKLPLPRGISSPCQRRTEPWP